MNRYGISLEGKITVVADIHLEYSKLTLVKNGTRKIVSKRVLVKKMLEHLSSSRMIIFNGDTAEVRWEPETKDEKEKRNVPTRNITDDGLVDGLIELRWLFRELKAMGLDSKTVYVTGNHDYNIRRYSMPAEVYITSHCRIATGDTFTLVTHGDIGPYAGIVSEGKMKENRNYAVPRDLIEYRKRLESRNFPPLPRLEKDWWLVCGHCHNPCRKVGHRIAGLPSLETFADPEGQGHLRFAAIDPMKGAVDLLKFPFVI